MAKRSVLQVDVNVATFAPAVGDTNLPSDEVFNNAESLLNHLSERRTKDNSGFFNRLKSVIQSVSRLKQRPVRRVLKEDSKGAILNTLEKGIATLDKHQSRAVIETSEGVQRIRGLAGSGKTIVLALKAAILHSKFPDWKICVTFNSRAMKGQFVDLIRKFTIEQIGDEPNWDQVLIQHAWGSAKEEGVYYQFCRENGVEYHDYQKAVRKFGRADDLIGTLCGLALREVKTPVETFDVVLVDEAQDFSKSFLQMCYSMLKPTRSNNPNDRRLVYAYDELQKLSEVILGNPQDIFGNQISFGDNAEEDFGSQDIFLKVCYRNSSPVLTTAHALGFGIYREPTSFGEIETNLVTMFKEKALWKDVGYEVVEGELENGSEVVLKRSPKTSPGDFLKMVDINEVVEFMSFGQSSQQAHTLVESIVRDIQDQELKPHDIVVVHPDARKTRDETSLCRHPII